MADGRGNLYRAEDLPPHVRSVARPRDGSAVRAARRTRPAAVQAELAGRMGDRRGRLSMAGSFDVRIWAVEVRTRSSRVRRVVAGRPFSESFATSGLADAFRSQLVTLARKGEPFNTETGLPRSLLRSRLDVTFLAHAREFA